MIRITRAGPLTSLQDDGRHGMLAHGIAPSGPMDRRAFAEAGAMLPRAGATGIEFTMAGLAFETDTPMLAACAGGTFRLAVNGRSRPWPARLRLKPGDRVDITPGPVGNYGYLRLERQFDLLPTLGSLSTNLTVGLGGFAGRALQPGDALAFAAPGDPAPAPPPLAAEGDIRVIWGLHADLFPAVTRNGFVSKPFRISSRLDRMGARLTDPTGFFSGLQALTLVSDPIVPGDIQILGDGTPIVLLRDHQPTGGYPRIATIATADLDRFVQLRPGTDVRFRPTTVTRAEELLR